MKNIMKNLIKQSGGTDWALWPTPIEDEEKRIYPDGWED